MKPIAVGVPVRPPLVSTSTPGRLLTKVYGAAPPLTLSVSLNGWLSVISKDAGLTVKVLGAGAGGWGELRAHAWFRGAGFTWEELERRELPVPSVPVLSGPLDTRNFAHFPEGARALADVGSAADADAGGDGDTHGEADLSEEQLYGSWDRCF